MPCTIYRFWQSPLSCNPQLTDELNDLGIWKGQCLKYIERRCTRCYRKENRNLKMRGRRQQEKRCLKSEFTFLQTQSQLFQITYFVKVTWDRERKFCCCLFTPSIKHEISHFHVVLMQWWQRNVQKTVMQEQICCFANQTYCFFLTFLLPSLLYGLKVPITGPESCCCLHLRKRFW